MLVRSVPYVLVVAPGVGVRSVAELITLTKQKPGQFSFGSAGTGSGTHMAGRRRSRWIESAFRAFACETVTFVVPAEGVGSLP